MYAKPVGAFDTDTMIDWLKGPAGNLNPVLDRVLILNLNIRNYFRFGQRLIEVPSRLSIQHQIDTFLAIPGNVQ